MGPFNPCKTLLYDLVVHHHVQSGNSGKENFSFFLVMGSTNLQSWKLMIYSSAYCSCHDKKFQHLNEKLLADCEHTCRKRQGCGKGAEMQLGCQEHWWLFWRTLAKSGTHTEALSTVTPVSEYLIPLLGPECTECMQSIDTNTDKMPTPTHIK